MATTERTPTSSEKKRLRDRRAQKNLRDKRERHIKALEERIAACERHHGSGWVRRLLTTLDTLYRENERLKSRQKHLQDLVKSWDSVDDSDNGIVNTTTTKVNGPYTTQASVWQPSRTDQSGSLLGFEDQPKGLPTQGEKSYNSAGLVTVEVDSEETPMIEPFSPPTPIPSCDVPAWSLMPLIDNPDNTGLLREKCPWLPWLGFPDLIAECPPTPTPLELLHGTRRNFLADSIEKALRRRRCRDPERLGLGWLMYVFCKWQVSPDPVAFARIPPFLRPVMSQFQQSHPNCLDLVIWPQMRTNLIHNWRRYEITDVLGLMSCCVKVRWPWGEDVLERDSQDILQMKKSFYDIIMREDGWGMTPEFIKQYPDLLAGLNKEAICYTIA